MNTRHWGVIVSAAFICACASSSGDSGGGGGGGGAAGACTGEEATAAFQGSSDLALSGTAGANLCFTTPVKAGTYGGIWGQESNPPSGIGHTQIQIFDGCRRIDINGRGPKTANGQTFSLVPNKAVATLELGQAWLQYTDACTGDLRLWVSQSGTLTVNSVGPSVKTPNVAGAFAATWTISNAALAPASGFSAGVGTFTLGGPIALDPYSIAQ